MSALEQQTGAVIRQYEQLIVRRLSEMPGLSIDLKEAAKRAFIKKHREIEDDVDRLSRRLAHKGFEMSRIVKVGARVRLCCWKAGLGVLEGETGFQEAYYHAQN